MAPSASPASSALFPWNVNRAARWGASVDRWDGSAWSLFSSSLSCCSGEAALSGPGIDAGGAVIGAASIRADRPRGA